MRQLDLLDFRCRLPGRHRRNSLSKIRFRSLNDRSSLWPPPRDFARARWAGVQVYHLRLRLLDSRLARVAEEGALDLTEDRVRAAKRLTHLIARSNPPGSTPVLSGVLRSLGH